MPDVLESTGIQEPHTLAGVRARPRPAPPHYPQAQRRSRNERLREQAILQFYDWRSFLLSVNSRRGLAAGAIPLTAGRE